VNTRDNNNNNLTKPDLAEIQKVIVYNRSSLLKFLYVFTYLVIIIVVISSLFLGSTP